MSASVSGDIFPDVTAHIIDGATILNMRMRKVAKTIGEYTVIHLPHSISRLEHVSRLNIVWDQYFSKSSKAHTQKNQEERTRRRMLENTLTPKNWVVGFLHNRNNRTELLNQVRTSLQLVRTLLLKTDPVWIIGMRVCVCLCACVSLPKAINN